MACPKRCSCMTWNIYWQATIFAFILILYLIIGGAIFVALEQPAESQRTAEAKLQIQQANAAILKTILNISNITEEMAQNVTNTVINTLSQLAPQIVTVSKSLTPLWQLGPAIFFTTTVVTTIGYGNIAPSTPGGQTFFVFYAIVGIPLALVVFSSVGTILSNALGSLVDRIKTKHPRPLKAFVVVTAIAIAVTLFVFIPGVIFMAIEGWTYRESVYYCVVSLTTIGFGDYVPGQSTSTDLPVGVRGVYKICTACWLLLGISFLSLLIAEVQKLYAFSVTVSRNLCNKKKPEDAEEKKGGKIDDDVPTETKTEEQTEKGGVVSEHKDMVPSDQGMPKDQTDVTKDALNS